mmetsp:Transcript_18907/g.54218  ORF Transcript_18907/g.54218 Transcript_18907/m.54218 type:complete len:345 (-) Transcript_18907:979-2013(-)
MAINCQAVAPITEAIMYEINTDAAAVDTREVLRRFIRVMCVVLRMDPERHGIDNDLMVFCRRIRNNARSLPGCEMFLGLVAPLDEAYDRYRGLLRHLAETDLVDIDPQLHRNAELMYRVRSLKVECDDAMLYKRYPRLLIALRETVDFMVDLIYLAEIHFGQYVEGGRLATMFIDFTDHPIVWFLVPWFTVLHFLECPHAHYSTHYSILKTVAPNRFGQDPGGTVESLMTNFEQGKAYFGRRGVSRDRFLACIVSRMARGNWHRQLDLVCVLRLHQFVTSLFTVAADVGTERGHLWQTMTKFIIVCLRYKLMHHTPTRLILMLGVDTVRPFTKLETRREGCAIM